MSLTPHQATLFADITNKETIVLKEDGLDACYHPSCVPDDLAQQWVSQLIANIQWRQDIITVYGKQHPTPRLSCWMGESWMTYSYSNHTMQPEPWQSLPWQIKEYVETFSGETFNSVLINYYRDGQDSNGWHADDEPELGDQPVIASLSLGGARDFMLRSKANHAQKHKLALEHGSLLLMRGQTQDLWQHHVPKRAHAEPRINLTFRTIFSD